MQLSKVFATAVILLTLGASTASAADEWKPANGKLMTRWAKDVSPEKVLPEYPRPQMVREKWLNLNGLWEFAWAREGDATPTAGEPLKDSKQILVPFPPESALSGVMEHASDRMVYRRTFEVPKDWAGQRVLLHFGAVDWEATVRVNGKAVGTHRGGYDPFRFDITDALKPEGSQELVVSVFDPTDTGQQAIGKQRLEPKGIWYTPTSGVWQTVWVEPVPKENYVERLHIVPDLDASAASVTVDAGGESAVSVDVVVTDGDAVVAKGSGVSGRAAKITLPEPKAWSPDCPHLYGLRVTLRGRGLQPDNRIDSVQSYFAMRKIEVKPDAKGVTRIHLNNEPVFQVGLLDQGFWPDGLYTAPTDEALKYDIEVTKQLGFNMARKHVKVEPARWYYHADTLGLIVWQDMPSGFNIESADAKKQFEAEWKGVIDALRNHPSIVMWVVFNEGWGQYDTERLTNWTKEYDPSRLANNASGWVDFPVGDVIDMHNYPGPGSPRPEEKRAAVLGEFGGLGLYVPEHHWTGARNFSYRGMESAEELEDEFTKLFGRLYALRDEPGLSAAVYTQTTDVEGEINGLMTYDRVLKVDAEKIKAAVTGNVPVLKTAVLIPTSQEQPQTWRYTFEQPAEDWSKPGFDDSGWKEGPGGFGTEGTPGAVVRTKWDTADIWLRRTVKLPADLKPQDLYVLIHHDEACEVYINGVRAVRKRGHVNAYFEQGIHRNALEAIKPGEENVIAVHCNQTVGGQFIDVGFVRTTAR